MRLTLWTFLSALAALAHPALAQDPPAVRGVALGIFSPAARWVYHYTRTAPEGHPDESLLRDHYVVWTVQGVQPSPEGGAAVTFQEEGGPDDKAKRKTAWYIDPAGCWFKDANQGQSGPAMCPITEIPSDSALPGGAPLRGLVGASAENHTAIFSPSVGIVSYNIEQQYGANETWILVGYAIGTEKAGLHDLKPVRCDWDQSLRNLPTDKPTTLTLGPKKDPLTAVLDPVDSTLILSRGGAVIGQMCTPSANAYGGDNGVSLQSLKGWVAPDGAAYIALHAKLYWDGGSGSYEDKVIVLRVHGKSVSEVQSFEAASYGLPDQEKITFHGPMLMQAGSECAVEFWLNDKTKAPHTKTVAAYTLSGSWPLAQSRGSLTPRAQTFTLLKDFEASFCTAPGQ